ncbi:Predicted arabinose efflux permease, MFS family [Pedococcus cremeus]|uniref:Predicted arabinose efflux permease, MFS family n=1 Tax=Pedococcus cremeus TaxID=587636 RepID=A0A1H9QK78_9MICO|nr:MFS transporter [Pedococcus cremeus]SER60183.1 Predicted arabinose efflux permease, MFS family [Pedococcus cremeus]
MTLSDAASVRLANPLVRQRLSRSFPALTNRNFRLLLLGLLVSGTGGWIQRIAQDWLVLTLTDSPTAVGVVTAFQFVPTLVLGMHGGMLADRFSKRRLLLVTQVSMALTAAALAAVTLAGHVEVWHVYGLALVLGVITAADNPVRQSFVSEVVKGPQLPGAISLVSCTFQIGAMAGPVLGGLLMGSVGAGYAFAINAASFIAPVVALSLMRDTGGASARRSSAAAPAPSIREGLRYARRTSTVLWPIVMVGAFGFFTISLPVTLAAFAKNEFHSGASGLGLLNGVVALGALFGAMRTARRTSMPRLRSVGGAGAALAAAMLLAAAAPNQTSFTILLVLVGAANLGFLTTAQSLVQVAALDHLRGRVVGLYMLVFIGSGAIGGPVVGFMAEHFGARVALLASGALPAVVTVLVCQRLARRADLRLSLTSFSVRMVRPTVVSR